MKTYMQEKELYQAPVCEPYIIQVEGVICASGEGVGWTGDYLN